MFRGCKNEDMPPHIYAMAQAAYRGMLATRRDHSLVFLGRSGSGKTTNFKHALHYLVLAAGTVNKVSQFNVESINYHEYQEIYILTKICIQYYFQKNCLKILNL